MHTHPTPDDLEYYAMHSDRQDDLIEQVEEHLLVCESCRADLDAVEQDLRVLKILLRELEPGPFIQ